jgi:hypothetical protein
MGARGRGRGTRASKLTWCSIPMICSDEYGVFLEDAEADVLVAMGDMMVDIGVVVGRAKG